MAKRGRKPHILPFCKKCGVVRVREKRRQFCSPKCAGNRGVYADAKQHAKMLATKAKRREKRQAAFLEALRLKGTIAVAARASGVAKGTISSWRRDYPDFARRVEDVQEYVLDPVEAGLIDRAVRGVPKGIYYKGEKVGEDLEFDTPAAIFWLRSRRREVFGDRVGITHSNFDGTPLQPSLNAVQILIKDAATLDDVRVGQRALPAPANSPPVEASSSSKVDVGTPVSERPKVDARTHGSDRSSRSSPPRTIELVKS